MGLIEEDRPEEAVSELRRSLAGDPDFLDGHFEMARCLRRMGQYRNAFPHVDACVANLPEDWEALKEAAEIRFLAGEVEKATPLFETLHEIDPEDEDIASTWVAISLVHEGPKKALKRARSCLEANPNWVGGHLYLGNIQEINGRLVEAEEAYQRALDLMPDHHGARENLERLKAGSPLETSPLGLTYDGIFLSECGRLRNEGYLGRAAELMEYWRERFPEHPLYRRMLVEIYRDQGQFHLALQLLHESDESERLDPQWRFLEARLLLDSGKTDEAVGILEELREEMKFDPAFQECRAEALLASARLEEALQAAEQGLEIEPSHAGIWFLLAKIQKRLERNEDCHQSLEKTILFDPQHVGANFALGIEHLQEGRDRQAVDPLRKVVDREPDRVEGWRHLAIALSRLKEYEAAVEPWSQVMRLAPGDSQASGNLEKIQRLLKQSNK
ncbi:MAG: tetratricopeptide repeat protein [Candidatus Omnitrophica bacterium]|nr:tetratricopeptide repeat protein [Candidatus Omnitrophota bacterium]